ARLPESCGDPLAALDVRAADDRVAASGEADPGLALAVVIRRPDDENCFLAADANGLCPFGLDAAPDPDERVLLPLAPDRRLLRVAREHARVGRQLHQDVHHRAADGVVVVARAADSVLEQRVAGEDDAAAVERETVGAVPRARKRAEAQSSLREVAGDDRKAEPALVLDVVVVPVRAEDGDGSDAPALV